jgi:hypothetical protein
MFFLIDIIVSFIAQSSGKKTNLCIIWLAVIILKHEMNCLNQIYFQS